jgi:GDP-L-fucose synthase
MNQSQLIYIAGHRGLVGSAIARKLRAEGYTNLITRSRAELDLTRQSEVESFFAEEQPEVVILAAAKVGGILANRDYPADFIRENLLIQTNIIDGAYRSGAKKLLFLGSSCIYPKHAPQPMREEHLLSGELEPTNDAYAIAKIAGIKMCQAYRRQYGLDAISLMPTNLYGPGDNFDLNTSHVLPALLRKFHEAKEQGSSKVLIWGTGTPRREFLHVDDLADASYFVLQASPDKLLSVAPDGILNIGTGQDGQIKELAVLIGEIVGGDFDLEFDTSKPDGTPRKLLDVSRMDRLGWKAQITLDEGIRSTYEWMLKNMDESVSLIS